MKSFEGGVEPFVVAHESAESSGPGEASFDHPAARQQHEAAFRQGVFDHFEPDAVALGGLRRVWPGVALIDVSHLDRASGDLLHVLSQRLNLSAIALIGRGHRQREQVAQRVDGDVDLGALAPFRAVVSCPRPALGRGLQRAAVDTRYRRLALASGKLAQQNARVFDQPLKASRPHPGGVAVDGAGNVFVANYSNQIKEVPPDCVTASCVKIVGSGFNQAAGVALDGAGSVFVADTYNGAVKELLAGSGYVTTKTLASGLSFPQSIAVDTSRNVFVADQGDALSTDHSLNQVKEIVAAGGYTTINTLGSGFIYPSGIAVDASSNVFVADTGNNAVCEILAAGGYTTTKTLGGGFQTPAGVAVDANGNIYVADTNNFALKEILAAGGYVTVNTALCC
jgi:hypothetical protein